MEPNKPDASEAAERDAAEATPTVLDTPAPEGDSVVEASAGGPVEATEQAASEPAADAEPAADQVEGEGAESKMKWYAVHTYSGHENRARLSLLDRIRNAGLQDKFGEVLIPTEQVVEMAKGQRRTMTRKFYPGYMFVQLELDDHTRSLVKNTPKITGFLGGTNPVPVKDSEIAGINRQMSEGAIKPKPRISFDEGENVRVTDGPFSNFNGIVEEVRPEKQKIRVLVSIFGRATPIELDFGQVEKA